MHKKVMSYEVTQSMKISKCDELVRNIKKLAQNSPTSMQKYLLSKEEMKKCRKDLNDKGLQQIFFFVAVE